MVESENWAGELGVGTGEKLKVGNYRGSRSRSRQDLRLETWDFKFWTGEKLAREGEGAGLEEFGTFSGQKFQAGKIETRGRGV